MNMTQKVFKHIVIEEENYQLLRKLGCVGDSFNDIISKLLNNRGFD